jgi:hypothetical protein
MTAPTILSAPHVSTKYKPNKEKKAGEERRINLIVELDQRRKEARGRRDKGALLEIAAEYMLINCPNTAAIITYESENL